jgi:hypothetical protein
MATNNNVKNSRHHAELIGHAMDTANYNAHGHAFGKQGARRSTRCGRQTPTSRRARFVQQSAAGQASQGAMSQGGTSGADYQTTSTGNIGDADSQGPTGY